MSSWLYHPMLVVLIKAHFAGGSGHETATKGAPMPLRYKPYMAYGYMVVHTGMVVLIKAQY